MIKWILAALARAAVTGARILIGIVLILFLLVVFGLWAIAPRAPVADW